MVTPGTITSAQALDETKNNYLMGIVYLDSRYGISTADISTGEFLVTEVESDRELFDEINKFSPSEIICNNAFYGIRCRSLTRFKETYRGDLCSGQSFLFR